MVNIAMIMVVLRCVSRSIVLDSRLRSLSRCTLTAGRKQNPQKVESTPPPHDHKTAAAQIFLDHGRFVRNTPKTEQNRSRTNADFLPDCFSFSQRHDSRSRSPHKTQAADSLLFFAAFNRKRAAILKPSLFQKTLHQIAQYSAQYFMQYFTIYFSICSCISGYCVVYFNQAKGKTQRQRSIT